VACLTLVLAAAARASADHDNRALLHLQVRQTAVAVSAALPSSQAQLADALTVASATGSPQTFTRVVTRRGLAKGAVSETFWELQPSGPVQLAQVGSAPLPGRTGRASGYVAQVRPGPQLRVTRILAGQPRRLGYALASNGSPRYIAHAEAALASNHRLNVPSSSPFGDLDFAVYFGRGQHQSELVQASVATPLMGDTASASVPFGNTFITVVATPRGSLVGWLSDALPWIVLATGAVLSCVRAATVEYIARRRQRAEKPGAGQSGQDVRLRERWSLRDGPVQVDRRPLWQGRDRECRTPATCGATRRQRVRRRHRRGAAHRCGRDPWPLRNLVPAALESFPAEPSSVPAVRSFVRSRCPRLPGAILGDLSLIVFELATNALQYAGTTFDVTVELHDGMVQMEVSDVGVERRRCGRTRRSAPRTPAACRSWMRWRTNGVYGRLRRARARRRGCVSTDRAQSAGLPRADRT
jgi:hypothetical protein